MRIPIYTDKESHKVRRVDTRFPEGITDDELKKRVEEYNNNESNQWSVEIVEVDGLVCEAFKFLLGDDEYRTTYELTDLKGWFDELNQRIEELDDARSDIEYDIRQMIRRIEEKEL
jgi:predicted  nucleic acid-binding Zn-ribbon protein